MEMRKILRAQNATEALSAYNKSRLFAWTSFAFSAAGFAMVGVSSGIVIGRSYQEVNSVLFGVGGGLLVSGLALLFPNVVFLKQAVHKYNAFPQTDAGATGDIPLIGKGR
ncbi:MAG: hypothetical protein JXR45_21830 [Deltaproteobacteria bacterium]|nr:hypothetical protein [Deltaproteobacteria bacterium]